MLLVAWCFATMFVPPQYWLRVPTNAYIYDLFRHLQKNGMCQLTALMNIRALPLLVQCTDAKFVINCFHQIFPVFATPAHVYSDRGGALMLQELFAQAWWACSASNDGAAVTLCSLQSLWLIIVNMTGIPVLKVTPRMLCCLWACLLSSGNLILSYLIRKLKFFNKSILCVLLRLIIFTSPFFRNRFTATSHFGLHRKLPIKVGCRVKKVCKHYSRIRLGIDSIFLFSHT